MNLQHAIKELSQQNDHIDLSYLAMRKWIGIFGMLLAVIIVLGGNLFSDLGIQQSISIYYYSNMRDLLVGLLCFVSIFLITYKGETKGENYVTIFTGITSLLVALFPCYNENYKDIKVSLFQIYPQYSDKIHLISACLFFFFLGFISFVFFAEAKQVKSQLIKRNIRILYKISGIIIWLCLLGLIVHHFSRENSFLNGPYTTILLEAIALFIFGITWLIKGIQIKEEQILA
jgi:hypothetical protein